MVRTGFIAKNTNVVNDVHLEIIQSIFSLPSFSTIMFSFGCNVLQVAECLKEALSGGLIHHAYIRERHVSLKNIYYLTSGTLII